MNQASGGGLNEAFDPLTPQNRGERLKCVVVGDGGSGKTSLLTVYAKGEFPEDYVPTVFENYSTEITLKEKKYALMLWDTAGQEEYDRLRPLSYDHVDVIIICYDVTTPASFDNVSIRWQPETRHFCPGVPLILAACKTDLRSSKNSSEPEERKRGMSVLYKHRVISTAEGERLSKTIQAAAFVECSAKQNENVNELFMAAAQKALHDEPVSPTFSSCCKLL